MVDKRRHGSCLCGAVQFDITIAEPAFSICHCSMCRKWSAGPFEAAHGAGLTHDGGDALSWYRSSDWGERGFCSRCGTVLFWRFADKSQDMVGVSVEALDENDDLSLSRHIYIDSKPARYDFADDRPRLTEAEFLAELGFDPEK
jgi:hypothetical protein